MPQLTQQNLNEGTLYVVATPIGNLEDLTLRAVSILGSVDLVAAEDTRVTGRLLSHIGVQCRQMALHEHNEEIQAKQIVDEIQSGKSVALVSDAGTPLVSDPGFRLLRAAHAAGVCVSPIPGASACLAALSVSGLPTDRFVYEGFLPAKTAARCSRLQSLANETRSIVIYESVHRIAAAVRDMVDVLGAERPVFIGRELTKLHEQCVLADLQSVAARLDDGGIVAKGEFVLIVAGIEARPAAVKAIEISKLLAVLSAELPGKQAVALTAKITGHNKNDLYRQMLALKE